MTVNREPAEYNAGLETPLDFVYPFIIKSHPFRSVLDGDFARFGTLPEISSIELFEASYWVEAPSAAHSEAPQAEGRGKNRSCGWRVGITAMASPEDGGA
jgi:hypothetical protein